MQSNRIVLTIMNILLALTLSIFRLQSAFSAPSKDIKFNLELNSLEEWEPKTEDKVNEVYKKCATSTKTDSKVLQLFQAHILSNNAVNLIYCVDQELGILKDKTFYSDRISKQFLVNLGKIENEKVSKCFYQAKNLIEFTDFLVYFHECMISHTLWKRPGGELARENKQSCQTIHNITQYEICHEKDVMKIVRYSICDNMKSQVYEGSESIGFGYNFHRMALHTFAYLPPYQVYIDAGKCMEQGRAYKADELLSVMNCINDVIPPKWKSKTADEISLALKECKIFTNISEEHYNLLKQRIVKHDSIDFLRCVSWQLGMETGGCYVSHRTVAQIKLINPEIKEGDIEKMVEECYSLHLTTKENWDEFKYHQCIMTMKGLDNGSKYLESFM